MKKIPLTHGRFALVDDEDYGSLITTSWRVVNGYAYNHKAGHMHRVVLGVKNGKSVDHINHERLDNRRSNLRVASHRENLRNRGKPKSNTSGFKGVSRCANRWRAYIVVFYKQIHLGVFDDIEEASDAYKRAAIKYHGEFASF